MDLSIVVPIRDDHQRFLQNYAEYSAFFQKFHINFELIVVCSDSNSYLALQSALAKSLNIKVLRNQGTSSRNSAVAFGIINSSAPIIVVDAADQITPLASHFSAIHAFHSDAELLILTGNRLDPKRRPLSERSASKHLRLERHNSFYREIFNLTTQDPTSPFLALKNTPQCQAIAKKLIGIKNWYYTPLWLHLLKAPPSQVLEISIQESINNQSKFRSWVDTFNMYWTASKLRS